MSSIQLERKLMKTINLTDNQLYALEQNSDNGILPEIEAETNKRFWELAQ